eukprot:1161703-Pelagomonas_calceolata.AAC.7
MRKVDECARARACLRVLPASCVHVMCAMLASLARRLWLNGVDSKVEGSTGVECPNMSQHSPLQLLGYAFNDTQTSWNLT